MRKTPRENARLGASSAGYVALAIAAAALYALATPFSKMLLNDVPSNMMAALLYIGAGAGMALVGCARRAAKRSTGEPLRRGDGPYVAGMIALDVAAPLLLMAGLSSSSAESAALLNNFEIVATSLVAFALFGESITARLAMAIALITAACALLSVEGPGGIALSPGALLVLAAAVCWGFENNCTSRLSRRDPLVVVVVKGFGSGTGALAVAFAAGDALPALPQLLSVMLLGFVSFGLSIYCYVGAQRGLGAARTSAYYAVSPFIGAALSWIIFRESLTPAFAVALALMAAGAYLAAPSRGERERERGALGEPT